MHANPGNWTVDVTVTCSYRLFCVRDVGCGVLHREFVCFSFLFFSFFFSFSSQFSIL